MAHFAKLGVGNKVLTVEVVSNDIAINEQAGVDFLNNLYGTNDNWVQTYKDTILRKNFAGIGFKHDQTRDAFIPPKPYKSWVLNETTCLWEAPIAYPTDDQEYKWNETTTSWELD
tara:strand:+ start:1012 stop:1356 length:345 start_codon:yes stop_codon:yes gene_type:complete